MELINSISGSLLEPDLATKRFLEEKCHAERMDHIFRPKCVLLAATFPNNFTSRYVTDAVTDQLPIKVTKPRSILISSVC